MFDLDVSKMIVVGIVALAVIPPKDLPRVMRTVGQAVGKMRRMAAEFQGQFMEAIREADLESVKKEFEAINQQAKVDVAFDPAGMIRDDMTKAIQAPVEVRTSEVALNSSGTASEPPAPLAQVESQGAAEDPALAAAGEPAASIPREPQVEETRISPDAAGPIPLAPAARSPAPATAETPAANQSAAE
jgi:sec-independent protein translocase protein TatB